MRMSLSDQKAYPNLTRYVKHSLPLVIHVPSIVFAMKKIGQLSSTKLQKALAWGSNPDLRVDPLLKPYGEFSPGIGSNELRLQKAMVLEFEAGNGRRVARAGGVYLVGATILHELVHWGDDQDGIDRTGEEGEEFETLMYGSVIY